MKRWATYYQRLPRPSKSTSHSSTYFLFTIRMTSNPVNDFCEVMKNNTTLRELIVRGVQREDLTTEPNQQIVQLFHDIFTTNKALTKFKVQVPIGLHIQQRFNNFTDENERQQIRFKNDTKILMHNIVKSSSARQLLPIEIWRQIFSQLDYPGIKSLKAMTEAICK
jgi:hypothetical protein